MAGEGDIIAGLGLDMSDFSAGLDGALDLAKKFVSSFVSMMTTGVEKSFSKVRDEFRQSGNFDITTKQMQQLRFAADQSGTAFGTMEMALRRIGKTAGNATFGVKDAVTQMARLGLDPKQFAMSSLYDQAILVAKSMEGITNASQRMAIYSKIAGRSGIEVAQMFKELAKDTDVFHKIALGVSEISGAKIYAAKESLGQVDAILEDIYNQIAAKISPVITNVIQKMEDWGFTGVKLKATLDWIGAAYVTLAKYTVTFAYSIGQLFYEIGHAAYNLFGPINNNLKVISGNILTVANKMIESFVNVENVVGPVFVNIANKFAESFDKVIGDIGGKINAMISGVNMILPESHRLPNLPAIGSIGRMDSFQGVTAKHITSETILNSLMDTMKDVFGGGFTGGVMDRFKSNFGKISDIIDGLFKSDAKERPKGDNALSLSDDSKQKNTPLGYALNVTGQRASLAAMRMAFTPVQEVNDKGVIAAIERQTATMQGGSTTPP